uniref:Uncharacterized protein n=1 Tax=Photinus pyralis TaxID=7054 RepID=A0A1Y1NCI1_PHOPY
MLVTFRNLVQDTEQKNRYKNRVVGRGINSFPLWPNASKPGGSFTIPFLHFNKKPMLQTNIVGKDVGITKHKSNRTCFVVKKFTKIIFERPRRYIILYNFFMK